MHTSSHVSCGNHELRQKQPMTDASDLSIPNCTQTLRQLAEQCPKASKADLRSTECSGILKGAPEAGTTLELALLV